MTSVLITFLGRAPVNPKSSHGREYREANYRFGEAEPITTSFFAHALLQHLRRQPSSPPDRMVMFGTSGSMWDVLIETYLKDQREDDRLGLIEAADNHDVGQSQLDTLSDDLGKALNLDCELRIIPYAQQFEEQVAFLSALMDEIGPEDTVYLDLTHGLRHLPMLGLLAAMYLNAARGTPIEGIYYGALDLTEGGVTPVLELGGLLHIAEWIAAWRTYQKDDDYSAFAPLLGRDGVPPDALEKLERAAFLERLFKPHEARKQARSFLSALDKSPPGGASRLFEPTLRQRLDWAAHGQIYSWQRDLAFRYLDGNDHLRATIYGFEAFLTRLCQQQGRDHADGHQRNAVKENYEDEQKAKKSAGPEWDAYRSLREIRNALAHGSERQTQETLDRFENGAALKKEINRLLKVLLPGTRSENRSR